MKLPYRNFGNVNARVNRSTVEKVASVYDHMSLSNRSQAPQLQLSAFSAQDNAAIRAHIQKEAALTNGSELAKQASSLNKQAFLSGGMDLFTSVKGMIRNKLGVPDEVSHNLASPIIAKTMKIQQQYGGNEHNIADRLVTEMQGQLNSNTPTDGNALGDIQSTMSVVNTKGLEDAVKQQLINSVGMNAYEADRFKKAVVGAARDLATMLRPHKMNDIAGAIVAFIAHHGDPGLVFGLNDNQQYIQEIGQMLDDQQSQEGEGNDE